MAKYTKAKVGTYSQRSVKKRIEAFFLENIGKVATREQIIDVATDPDTGEAPENWHQRLSELRTDDGYTILSSRDRKNLSTSEYLMPHKNRRSDAAQRVQPSSEAWKTVLERTNNSCEWNEGGQRCTLKNGEADPIGGGTVRLTPDHKQPHSINASSDPDDPNAWQALCGRHQVVKKNYWDNLSGKLNAYAIVQAAPEKIKRQIFDFLKEYFADV